MKSLSAIVRMRLATLKNRATHLRRDSVAKVFVVAFGLANVLGLGFWVSYESFRFIEGMAAFGPTLNAKMLSLFFFALLVLVGLSTVIVTYTTIFLAKETEFLFQYPVAPRSVFAFKITEALAFSSWASLFLCLPVLVAFGWVKKAPPTYYVQAAGSLLVFLLFAGFSGVAVTLLAAPLAKALSPRRILFFGGLLLAVLGWSFLKSFRIWDMDGENNLLILDRFAARLAAIQSPFFPSNWVTSAVLAAAAGNHREVAFHGGTLLANTLIFVPLFAWYGRSLYGRMWLGCHGASAPVRRKRPAAALAARRHWRRRGGPLRALVWKDVLVFLRDPTQTSQSVLFLLLIVIYSLSLGRMPRYLSQGNLQLVVYFANLGAISALLSSFTSRFLFPMISLEGKPFWLVGLAPIDRSYILRAKAALGLGIALSLGVATAVVSNQALGTPPALFAGAVFTVILASACLTALATGLGAAYPLFEEDNPARIAAGLGGTLNFFASALAVAILIGIQAAPYLVFRGAPGAWAIAGNGLALAFTAGLTAAAYRVGAAAMARREF